MEKDLVKTQVEELRTRANYTTGGDWAYTRDLGNLKDIRYTNDPGMFKKIRGSVEYLFHRNKSPFWPHGLKERLFFAKMTLEKEKNHPDGVLSTGNILTYWEEDGEYIQLVQPSVGLLLAEWMEANPHSKYAKAIAEEMERIRKDYAERLGHGRLADTVIGLDSSGKTLTADELAEYLQGLADEKDDD